MPVGENDGWEIEVYVVEDYDGSVIGHSQSTEAYEIYGEDPALAEKIANAQGIAEIGLSQQDYADHFGRTAEQRKGLEQYLNEKNNK